MKPSRMFQRVWDRVIECLIILNRPKLENSWQKVRFRLGARAHEKERKEKKEKFGLRQRATRKPAARPRKRNISRPVI